MSNSDDSASRRDRRPGQRGPQRRPEAGQDRDDWRNPSAPRDRNDRDDYFDRRRDTPVNDRSADAPRSFSNFRAPPYDEPRVDPVPPPPPQRGFDQPVPNQSRDFDPPPPPQSYYPDQPVYREPPRVAQERDAHFPRALPEPPPPSIFPQHERNADLYGRDVDSGGYNQAYDNHTTHEGPAGFGYSESRAGGRDTIIDQASMRGGGYYEQSPIMREPATPQDDYERNFAARIAAQEAQASRFYLPEDMAQKQPAQNTSGDRGYPQQPYDVNTSHNTAPTQPAYQRPDDRAAWADDGQNQYGSQHHDALQTQPRNELDEDFFADDDEVYEEESAPKKSRKGLIAAALAGSLLVGGSGAYVYKTLKSGSNAESAASVIRADTKPSKEPPSNAGGRQFANGSKAIYERLTPEGGVTGAATDPNSGPRSAPPPAPQGGSSLEDRIEEALRKNKPNDGGPSSQPPSRVASNSGPSSASRPDQPTAVRGEIYRPDGTRMESPRPTVLPGFGSQSQMPAPFGPAPAPGSAQAAQGQIIASPRAIPSAPPAAPVSRSAALAPTPTPVPAPLPKAVSVPVAVAKPTIAGGYVVQLKASQDEKASNRELQSLTEKFGVVLGEVSLSTKTVDLGDKGVWFRTVAGPVTSQDAANELCTKLKGAGLGSCIVRKSE